MGGDTSKIVGLSEDCLKNNLAALALRSPGLHQYLCGNFDRDHILVASTPSGDPSALLDRGEGALLHSAQDPAAEAEKAASDFRVRGDVPVLVLGLGLGYYLEALLRRTNPCHPVIAYEKDPRLLCLTLMRRDYRRDILAGRVEFVSDIDAPRLNGLTHGRGGVQLWPHPVLGPLYERAARAGGGIFVFPGQAAEPHGGECEGRYRRAAVVAGGLFTEDVAEALRQMGLNTLYWYLSDSDGEDSIRKLFEFAPQVVLSINYRHGLSSVCRSMGIPCVVWEIDPTIERLPMGEKRYPLTFIYTYRKSHVARFREAGFSRVEYLPLAANPARRHPLSLGPSELNTYGADVSFVGTSMAEQAEDLARLYCVLTRDLSAPCEEHGAGIDYARILRAAIEHQMQNPDSYVMEEFWRIHMAGRSPVVRDGEGRLVDLAACAAERAASLRRALILSALAGPERTCSVKVWGDPGWRSLLPEGIEYCRNAGHFTELTHIYNASRINLDIGRIYQRDIVTMRVFDILACKGFALVEHSDDLEDLFTPGEDLASYRSVSEVPSLVEYYLSNEAERQRMAENGFQKVLGRHTIRKRLEQVIADLP